MNKLLLSEHKKLLPIYLILLADVLAFTVPMPILPFYMESLSATPMIIGLLGMTFGLCQFTAGPLLGVISDRYGRRPVLIFSQIGTFVGLILLASSSSFKNPLFWVFAARAIDGATAGNISVAHAYVADITPPSSRGAVFALMGSVFGIGFLIGPTIATTFVRFGFFVPILMAALFSTISIVLTCWLIPQPTNSKNSKKAPKIDLSSVFKPALAMLIRLKILYEIKALRSPLILQGLFALAFSLYFFGLPLFAERRFTWEGMPFHAREVGLIFTGTAMSSLILQILFLGRLIKKYGEEKLTRNGFVLAAVGYLTLALSFNIFTLILALCSLCVGNTLLRASLVALVSRGSSKAEQGLTMGALQSMYSLSDIAAPVFAGWLLGHTNENATIWHSFWALSAGFLTLAGAVLASAIRSTTIKEYQTMKVGSESLETYLQSKGRCAELVSE